MIRRLIIFSIAVFLLIIFTDLSYSSGSSSHSVIVKVQSSNEININRDNITLKINSATAGSIAESLQSNSSCDLLWSSNRSDKKITVATDLSSPNFTLKASAHNIRGGRPASEVTLSTTARDFITGIANARGKCDLHYTARTNSSMGTEVDIHTITYTFTDR